MEKRETGELKELGPSELNRVKEHKARQTADAEDPMLNQELIGLGEVNQDLISST